jgi:hypothetical protein
MQWKLLYATIESLLGSQSRFEPAVVASGSSDLKKVLLEARDTATRDGATQASWKSS